jgi:hypothetical protein
MFMPRLKPVSPATEPDSIYPKAETNQYPVCNSLYWLVLNDRRF